MRVKWTVERERSVTLVTLTRHLRHAGRAGRRPYHAIDMSSSSLEVSGPARLAGRARVVGAKNSVLKVMAAALLAEGRTTLSNVPDILDVPIMSEVLRGLGAEVSGHAPDIAVTVPERLGHEAAYEHVRRIRGSVCVLG